MLSTLRAVVWGAAIFASAALAAGCQSSNSGAATTRSAQGVTCSKCQITWVREPVTTGGGKDHVISYRTRKSMECGDCRSVVDNFFRTGRLEHTCKTCGDAIEVCQAH
jgi:hypothetical protein